MVIRTDTYDVLGDIGTVVWFAKRFDMMNLSVVSVSANSDSIGTDLAPIFVYRLYS